MAERAAVLKGYVNSHKTRIDNLKQQLNAIVDLSLKDLSLVGKKVHYELDLPIWDFSTKIFILGNIH